MSDTKPLFLHTRQEELANVITHGLGLLAALIGGAVVIHAAAGRGEVRVILTALIYVLSLVLVYLSSTGFHMTREPESRKRWRKFDHAAIYGLIAGSYTPVVLVALGGVWGWSLFIAVWTMAIVGILAKTVLAVRFQRWEKLDLALYVAMGWMCVIAIGPIVANLSRANLTWLVAGGVTYTLGTIFYMWDRLPFNHAVWHLFVIGGSVCHFIVVHSLMA